MIIWRFVFMAVRVSSLVLVIDEKLKSSGLRKHHKKIDTTNSINLWIIFFNCQSSRKPNKFLVNTCFFENPNKILSTA